MVIIFRFGEARNANSVGMLNRIPHGKEIFGKVMLSWKHIINWQTYRIETV
jgi:hypothetical protein